MVAYTAYAWLLQNARLSLVTTYAYVNPVVAVLLGALILDEPLSTRTLLASAAIVAGVILIVRRGARSPEERSAVSEGHPRSVTERPARPDAAECGAPRR
jgi:drug/metabolite transporter (DMT)-like permease